MGHSGSWGTEEQEARAQDDVVCSEQTDDYTERLYYESQGGWGE